MASEVDICNIALGHLGDAANIQAINPPDGSAQAEHCARFYPIARDSLLEMHDWSFCSRRIALGQTTNPSSTWAYCYVLPANCLNANVVLDPAANDDTSTGLAGPLPVFNGSTVPFPITNVGVYTPQPFILETLADGTEVVLTNQPNAVLKYTVRVTDTTKFSATFIHCLSHSLASMLAGPVIKGQAGTQLATSHVAIAFGRDGKSGLFGIAASADANNKRQTTRDRHQVAWLNAR